MSNLASILPPGWKLLSVKDAFAIRNNLRKPISQEEREKIKGEYPYYGPTKAQGYISSYEQDGEFALIGEDGDHFLKYQNISMTQLISGKCTVNNHAHVVEGTEICTAEWFYYFFMHKELTSFLTRQGAGRFKLNKAALEKIPVLVPPVAEQTKIAKILSTWDKAIATTERLLDNSQQRKQALMQQLLTGQKRFVGFTDQWDHFQLSDIAAIVMGSSPRSEAYNESGLGLPLLQGNADIENRRSSPRVFTSQITKECKPGDILLSVRAPVGHIALSAHHACIGRGIAGLRAHKEHDQSFLYQWLVWFEPQWESISQGSTFESVNSNDIRSLIVMTPPLPEQQKIAQVLSTADAEITNLQAQLAKLKLEKKALMQQLLTGQRRVRLDDELEEQPQIRRVG